ncbi:3365_t:CDS:2, partial [Racocetra fulgida]
MSVPDVNNAGLYYIVVSSKILFDRWKSYRKKENRFTVMGPPITEASNPITNITDLPPSSLPTSDLPTSDQSSNLQVPPKLTSIPEESETTTEGPSEVDEGSRIDAGNIRVTVDVRTEVFERDTQQDYEI